VLCSLHETDDKFAALIFSGDGTSVLGGVGGCPVGVVAAISEPGGLTGACALAAGGVEVNLGEAVRSSLDQ